MAIIQRNQYRTNINSFIVDNNQRLISEEDVRNRFLEAEESYLNKIDGFDVPQYSNVTTYVVGDSVVYNDAIYQKINSSSIGILPTDITNWSLFLTSPFATISKYGISRKADVSDIITPTDNTRYITPYLLAEYLNLIGGIDSLDDLNDVTLSSPLNGQALIYNSGTTQWENQNIVIPTSLDTLTDVTLVTPLDGQALIYNSGTTQWENTTINTSNLYNSDGTLTGNRIVTGGGFSLDFTALSDFSIATDNLSITIEDNLGSATFTDNRTIPLGLRYGGDYGATYMDRSISDWGNVKNRIGTIIGIPDADTDLGTFTGTILTDNNTVKGALQELEDVLEKIPRDKIEFYPSIETVQYIEYIWPFTLKEALFDTAQIDSVSYTFRKSSSGSGGVYSSTYSSISLLQAGIVASTPSNGESVTIQISVAFDVLWTDRAFVSIISSLDNNV